MNKKLNKAFIAVQKEKVAKTVCMDIVAKLRSVQAQARDGKLSRTETIDLIDEAVTWVKQRWRRSTGG